MNSLKMQRNNGDYWRLRNRGIGDGTFGMRCFLLTCNFMWAIGSGLNKKKETTVY